MFCKEIKYNNFLEKILYSYLCYNKHIFFLNVLVKFT